MTYRTKAFTLVELIISIVIVALLTGVIFSTYQTIIDITVRVENEKIVANEMLFAHQTIQNLVDNYTIDFGRYWYPIPNSGMVSVLYLTGRWWDSWYEWFYQIQQSGSSIILMRNGSNFIPLTDPDLVSISGLQFAIVPYMIATGGSNTIPIGNLFFLRSEDVYHPWFWMRGMVYIRNYRPRSYIWSVKQPLQSFFNIRSY